MKQRHLQAYWPETNVLIARRFDPVSGEPDYNALVTVDPIVELGATTPALVNEPARILPAGIPEPVAAERRGER